MRKVLVLEDEVRSFPRRSAANWSYQCNSIIGSCEICVNYVFCQSFNNSLWIIPSCSLNEQSDRQFTAEKVPAFGGRLGR